MDGFDARVIVSGMGSHLYDLRFTAIKGAGSPAVIPSPTKEVTPWVALAEPAGLVLVQRRASDRKSCLRFASWGELEEGRVSDYAMLTGGPDPVHGGVDASGRVFAAAHGDGLRAMCIAAFPDGVRCMSQPVTVAVGSKCSQAYWHPTLPGVLYVTNLGGDRLLRYAVAHADEPAAFGAGSFVLQQDLPLPPGSGPRRMVLLPGPAPAGAAGGSGDDAGEGGAAVGGSLGWVVNELGATVSTLSVDPATGALALEHTVSSLPPGAGRVGITSAQVVTAAGGTLLFASNRSDRGEDSVAAFRTGAAEESTTLDPLGWATGATTAAELGWSPPHERAGDVLRVPRDMAVLATPDGREFLLVANQAGETVTVFAVEPPRAAAGGLPLRAVGCVPLPKGAQPTCVLPLPPAQQE